MGGQKPELDFSTIETLYKQLKAKMEGEKTTILSQVQTDLKTVGGTVKATFEQALPEVHATLDEGEKALANFFHDAMTALSARIAALETAT